MENQAPQHVLSSARVFRPKQVSGEHSIDLEEYIGAPVDINRRDKDESCDAHSLASQEDNESFSRNESVSTSDNGSSDPSKETSTEYDDSEPSGHETADNKAEDEIDQDLEQDPTHIVLYSSISNGEEAVTDDEQ